MFTTQMDAFKTQHQELQRRAEQYRLIKALSKPTPWAARIAQVLGQTLISSGQELVRESRAAL
jgi:hypothetical protein